MMVGSRALHIITLLIGVCSAFACSGKRDVAVIPEPSCIKVRGGFYHRDGVQDYAAEADVLKDNALRPDLGAEGYMLDVTRKGILIKAATDTGVFYATQTLRQITGPEGVRCVSVKDVPRFPYRGIHLDVSRHFFPKEEVCRILDEMARYKLNNFHFHLTDNGGWRIRIDSYPLLTRLGAFRPSPAFSAIEFNKEFCPEGTPGAYGGYYTKDDIREIVAYASERMINVIPEIDLPAHSDAVFAAYPELNCTKKTSGNGEFCTALESSYTFACRVLDEIMELFPSDVIHIGGDEARKAAWKTCPDCNALMRANGWEDYDSLQVRFMAKVAEHVRSKGRTVAGWDELLTDVNLPESTVVYAYRGQKHGLKAAKRGYRTIFTPGEVLYFDWWQADPFNEPVAMGGYSPLKKVYSFDPVPMTQEAIYANESLICSDQVVDDSPELIRPENCDRIIGVQGCAWTEFIGSADHLHYMMFPRLLAVAETGWTTADRKSWDNFKRKLPSHLDRLQSDGFCVYDLHDGPQVTCALDKSGRSVVSMDAERYGAEIRYTLDGSEPDAHSKLYKKPFVVNDSVKVSAAAFVDGAQVTYTRCVEIVPGQALPMEYPVYWEWEMVPGEPHPFAAPKSFDAWKGELDPKFRVRTVDTVIVAAWTPSRGGLDARIDDVSCRLEHVFLKGERAYKITMTNYGRSDFAPVSAGLQLGIDTDMTRYPDWLGKWSPIYLDCRSTHFTACLRTPSGRTLGLFLPDPVASWSLDYNLGYRDPYWFYGHRILGVNLDLINALPLPEHNPQDLWRLRPGESKSWSLLCMELDSPESFDGAAVHFTGAPSIVMERTAWNRGDKVSFAVLGNSAMTVKVTGPDGEDCTGLEKSLRGCDYACFGTDTLQVRFPALKVGLYTIRAESDGKVTEGIVSVNRSWEYVMRSARAAAIAALQKPSSHVESWYGFHSAFIAAKEFPDAGRDSLLDSRFDYILGKLYSPDGVPQVYPFRIQNTASTISMLVERYHAYGRKRDLEMAGAMADWIIANSQAPNGAYMNCGVDYTSVIYPAKSILELSRAEQDAGLGDAANRHFASARKAVMRLVSLHGDFETEGEMTFEDGMVSCSALQMGMLALMLPPGSEERRRLTDEMLSLLHSHDCLTQLKVPDARRRGGTFRFWEAQYDVMMLPNMICSPHGWSAWRAYATYYAYLLTKDEEWLRQAWDAAGALSLLVGEPSDSGAVVDSECGMALGPLRWAFVVDPYVSARQVDGPVPGITSDSLTTGNPHPDIYGTHPLVVGEQYVDMISSWQGINTQDNDVHEAFKFIGETFLKNAFVIEREDGTFSCYNCTVSVEDGMLCVKPSELSVDVFHLDLRSQFKGYRTVRDF